MSDDLLKALLAPAQAKSPEPLTPFGSAAMEKRGPWMREYMPSTLADLLASYMAYAPMAIPAYRGRGLMPNRQAPQDFAIAPAVERNALARNPSDHGPDIMGGSQRHGVNAEDLASRPGVAASFDFRASPMEMRAMQGTKANNNATPEETVTYLRLLNRNPLGDSPKR